MLNKITDKQTLMNEIKSDIEKYERWMAQSENECDFNSRSERLKYLRKELSYVSTADESELVAQGYIAK